MHTPLYRYLSLLLLLVSSATPAQTVQLQQLTVTTSAPDHFSSLSGIHQLTLQFHFDQPAPAPTLFTQAAGEQLIIDFERTRCQLNTPAPVSPLHTLQHATNPSGCRLLLALEQPLSRQLHQNGDQLLLTLFTPHPSQNRQLDLSLKQVPLTTALKQITQQSGHNLILNGEISGTTSLNLQQVDWRDAFDLLIHQHQLQLTEQHGVLVVSPPVTPADTPIHSPEKPAVTTEIIPLHYADAADLKETLESNQKNPLLSEQGVLGIDQRTNSLLIQEQPERLSRIRTLIQQLDTPAKQVLIESRIVIASDDFSRELGARLGLTHLESAQQQWGFSLSGSSDAANNALNGTTPSVSGDNNRLAVNLPITNAVGRIGLTLAKLSTGSLIDLELSAAQLEGKTEIVANPRIITSNGYEATIRQGTEIPYRSENASGGTDVSFKDATMALKVTPKITPEHQIILTVEVKKDAAGLIYCDNCEPSVNTREVKTRVMIGDGETLVIGGIYEERSNDTENRVPLLSELPLIGSLFKNRINSDNRDELMIFITPSILPSPAVTTKVSDSIEQNQTKHLSRRADGSREVDHWQAARRITGEGFSRQ